MKSHTRFFFLWAKGKKKTTFLKRFGKETTGYFLLGIEYIKEDKRPLTSYLHKPPYKTVQK